MEQREKLIELIAKALDAPRFRNKNGCFPTLEENVADILVANGVVVLPCKVGDTVYVVKDKKIVTMQVEFYYFGKLGIHGRAKTINQNYNFKNRHIGKTVFFTREEAEKALAKRKGGEE